MSEPASYKLVLEFWDLVLSLASSLAVILGVCVAYYQLSAWKSEARHKRRAEVAEEALVAVMNVDDALRQIRNPLDRVPSEDANNHLAHYDRRYQRIVDRNEQFEALRRAQIAVEAVLNDSVANKGIETLFKIRNDIALAVEFLADSLDDDDEVTRKLKVEWRKTMSGSYGEQDEAGNRQIKAVEEIKAALGPTARYEERNP